jgi:hypothetical protein
MHLSFHAEFHEEKMHFTFFDKSIRPQTHAIKDYSKAKKRHLKRDRYAQQKSHV